MGINVEDIDVFIYTKNRPTFLQRAIQSLLDQSKSPDRITILDNSTNKDTEIMVFKLQNSILNYVNTIGQFGNYEKAKQLSTRKYVMVFHDDDVLNLQYLERVLIVLNRYKEINLVCSQYTSFYSDNEIDNSIMSGSHFRLTSKKKFAKYMYFCEGIAFSSAIYKGEYFRHSSSRYEIFGKFNDWPFMLSAVANGTAVILNDKNSVFSRIHADQDSNNIDNFPSLSQIVNWDLFFYNAIKPRARGSRLMMAQRATRYSVSKLSSLLNIDFDLRLIETLNEEFNKHKITLISDETKYVKIDDFINGIYLPRFKLLNSVNNGTTLKSKKTAWRLKISLKIKVYLHFRNL